MIVFILPDWMIWIMLFLFFVGLVVSLVLLWLYYRHMVGVYVLLKKLVEEEQAPEQQKQVQEEPCLVLLDSDYQGY